MATSSLFNDLPEDVVMEIFAWLRVEDIVLMRRVCKRLNRISYQRSVWAGAYLNASFSRHLEPLTRLSTSDLEHTLIRTVKADRVWNSSEPDPVAYRKMAIPIYSYTAMIVKGNLVFIGHAQGVSCYSLGAEGDEACIWTEDIGPIRMIHCDIAYYDGKTFINVFCGPAREQKYFVYVLELNDQWPCSISVSKKHLLPHDTSGLKGPSQLQDGCVVYWNDAGDIFMMNLRNNIMYRLTVPVNLRPPGPPTWNISPRILIDESDIFMVVPHNRQTSRILKYILPISEDSSDANQMPFISVTPCIGSIFIEEYLAVALFLRSRCVSTEEKLSYFMINASQVPLPLMVGMMTIRHSSSGITSCDFIHQRPPSAANIYESMCAILSTSRTRAICVNTPPMVRLVEESGSFLSLHHLNTESEGQVPKRLELPLDHETRIYDVTLDEFTGRLCVITDSLSTLHIFDYI